MYESDYCLVCFSQFICKSHTVFWFAKTVRSTEKLFGRGWLIFSLGASSKASPPTFIQPPDFGLIFFSRQLIGKIHVPAFKSIKLFASTTMEWIGDVLFYPRSFTCNDMGNDPSLPHNIIEMLDFRVVLFSYEVLFVDS